jgi:hypothetical protein
MNKLSKAKAAVSSVEAKRTPTLNQGSMQQEKAELVSPFMGEHKKGRSIRAAYLINMICA